MRTTLFMITLALGLSVALVGGDSSIANAQDASHTDAADAGTRSKVGQQVRDFELPIVGGDEKLKLSEAYADGPVVLVMLRGYPGYQCPICSRQFGDFRKQAKTLGEKAAKVILVYPGAASQLEAHADEFVGAAAIPSPLVMVRDPGMKMVDAWGLRWDAPRETAYPSTFVIDQTGKVVWAKVSEKHGGRASVDEVVKALEAL